MATAYSTLLGLALPVTGELSGTWGDTVNNSITSLLDSAIAGTTTLSADTTLTTTTGASNQARQAILLCTGHVANITITAPAQSKIYTVINASATYTVKIRGVGPTTGITIPVSSTATVAWNGSDFVDASGYINGNLRVNGTLSVTGVATFSAGTAALPAITTTGDTNTGIWFPAADTIAFTEGGVESMRIDSSGRLLIGGTTTYDFNGQSNLVVNGTANNSTITIASTGDGYLTFADGTTGTQLYAGRISYYHATNSMDFWTNGTSKMTLDSSGRLGIGTTTMSTSENLVVSNGTVDLVMSPGAFSSGNVGMIGTKTNHGLSFAINTAQKMAIDTSGNLLVGTTSASGIITTSTSAASQAGSIWTRNTSASAAAYSGLTVGNDAAINRAGFILASSGATTSGFLAANSVYAYAGTGQFAMLTESAQPILFGTNNTERMRLDSSGNLGIGTTSPVTRLSVNTATQNSEAATIGGVDYGGTKRGLSIRTFQSAGGDDCGVEFNAAPSNSGYGAFKFTASSTNLMTLDASGRLLVGATSIPFSSNNTGVISWSVATGSGGEGGFAFVNTSTSTSSDQNPALVISKGSSTYTSSQRFIQFYANGTSLQAMGGIVGNGATNVQFISLSDAREKDNIQAITGSLNKITALNPVEFDWKKTGEHINAGFIAQEVELVFPEYVVDNVANAGEEERKGLTGGMSAGFIAHLVKAIQEQQALITTLTARITALEGA